MSSVEEGAREGGVGEEGSRPLARWEVRADGSRPPEPEDKASPSEKT